MRWQHSECQDRKFALGGYSQGAQVVHSLMDQANFTALPFDIRSKILAVILIADPPKVSEQDELLWEDPYIVAQRDVQEAPAVWTWQHGPDALSTFVVDRTISVCNTHDIVCNVRWGSHTGETTGPWGKLVTWGSGRPNGRSLPSRSVLLRSGSCTSSGVRESGHPPAQPATSTG